MKKLGLGLLLCTMLFSVACSNQVESYTSLRPKNENMQDIQILEMKQHQLEVPVETTEPETTEPVVNEPIRPTNASSTDELERNGRFPFETTLYGTLNMRNGAGLDYEIVTTFYEGQDITITDEVFADGILWYSATSGIYEGYVNAEAYELVAPAVPAEEEEGDY